MEKNRLKLRESIDLYNSINNTKLTQKELAGMIMKEEKNEYVEFMLSCWNRGRRLGKLTPIVIIEISNVLGVEIKELIN